jgi:biopolymer transport protein TolR
MSMIQPPPPPPPPPPAGRDDAAEPVVTQRSRLENAEMDITPMIDMTFLLLIFFIVASKLGPKAHVELPKAQYGAAVVMQNAIILTVGEGEPMARVYKGESAEGKDEIPGGNVEEQEQAIVEYIEEEYRRRSGAGVSPENVLIQAARGLKHREVSRVAKAASRAEVPNLYVGVAEKR